MYRALTALQNISAWLTQYCEVFWGPGWLELPDHYSMLTAVSIHTGGTNTLCIMR